MKNGNDTITQLLFDWRNDDKNALQKLFPLTYDRLRKSAGCALNKFNNSHSIQGTELVNELYLSFNSQEKVDIKNSKHFYAIAYLKLTQILADLNKKKMAKKRHTEQPERLNDLYPSVDTDFDFYDFLTCRALEKLEAEDSEAAQIAQCMIIYGFNKRQATKKLGMSERTFNIKWRFAKERMIQYLDL